MLRRFRSMMLGMSMMPTRNMRMVSGLLVRSSPMMLGSVLVVLGGMLMVHCRSVVMTSDFFFHVDLFLS